MGEADGVTQLLRSPHPARIVTLAAQLRKHLVSVGEE